MQLFLDILYPVVLILLGLGLIVTARGRWDTKLCGVGHGYRVMFIIGIFLLVMVPIAIVFTVFFGRHFLLV